MGHQNWNHTLQMSHVPVMGQMKEIKIGPTLQIICPNIFFWDLEQIPTDQAKNHVWLK